MECHVSEKKLLLYIHTIGCQMNVYDSEQMTRLLAPMGYRLTPDSHRADLILVNTCAIRDKAEQKVFSYLGRLAQLKRRKPRLIIGVGGCVAQQEGARIIKRVPEVDLVFGTHVLQRLPDLVRRAQVEKAAVVDVSQIPLTDHFDQDQPPASSNEVSRFVTIMRGCDNYCTYCVVPYVRGPEISRFPERVIKEINALVSTGIKEVTLLGQNVNSYGAKQGLCSFAQLLTQINAIEGLARIRFTTSHPKDLSDELINAFADLDKLCNHIHLPVQSGSNRILKKMHRGYTRDAYLDKIAHLRHARPDIAVTSDFIVGFPGETDQDFDRTLDLIKTVGYDSVFAFKYSDRPNARATAYTNKISENIKKDRLKTLLKLQESYTFNKHASMVGKRHDVLVEGFSKKHNGTPQKELIQNLTSATPQWMGRTSCNKIVNFSQPHRDGARIPVTPGLLMPVRIDKAFPHSLWGTPLPGHTRECAEEGDAKHVA
jgi:tRNA-2-methylthio-N6-dimethylallyladenosine synthase